MLILQKTINNDHGFYFVFFELMALFAWINQGFVVVCIWSPWRSECLQTLFKCEKCCCWAGVENKMQIVFEWGLIICFFFCRWVFILSTGTFQNEIRWCIKSFVNRQQQHDGLMEGRGRENTNWQGHSCILMAYISDKWTVANQNKVADYFSLTF